MMTDAAEPERLRARVAELEAELDEMTAALASAYDQLVPLLQAAPASIMSREDVTQLVLSIVNAVEAQYGALFITAHGNAPAQWRVIPDDSLSFETVEAILGMMSTRPEAVFHRDVIVRAGVSTNWMFTPVMVGSRFAGAIGVGLINPQREFRAADAQIVTRMTERVAEQLVAVMLQETLDREADFLHQFRIAGDIQRSIQPLRPPKMKGLDVAAFWEPAFEVGGDAWGWHIRPDGRLGIFLVDVAGKGLAAAIAAVSMHSLLRGGMAIALPVDNLLRTLNGLFYETFTQTELIATAVAAVIDPVSGEVEIANAGHTPVLARIGGSWQHLKASVPPIGTLREIEPETTRLHLNTGDILLLYSDGISETPVGDGWWGADGIIGAVKDGATLPGDIVQQVRVGAERWRAGTAAYDDQTLVCLSLGPSQRLTLPARYDALDQLETFMRDLLGPADEQTHRQVLLAVHEICANIITHGYAYASGDILIDAACQDHMLSIQIRDFAQNAYVPNPENAAPNPDDLPEGGWGLIIVGKVMDEVSYERERNGNLWRLHKHIRNQPQTGYAAL